MAGLAGRSPEEEIRLQEAMRFLPGGRAGGAYAPREAALVIREAQKPRELLRPSVVEAAHPGGLRGSPPGGRRATALTR